jgi:hypothetical protein
MSALMRGIEDQEPAITALIAKRTGGWAPTSLPDDDSTVKKQTLVPRFVASRIPVTEPVASLARCCRSWRCRHHLLIGQYGLSTLDV